MRVASHVIFGYLLMLVLGAVWRLLPWQPPAPDLISLLAVYLGLTARPIMVGALTVRLVPATLGAVILGYLADLLTGTPRGLLALNAGVMCGLGHLVHSALIVRGRLFTVVFSFVVAIASGVFLLLVRLSAGLVQGGAWSELLMLLGTAFATGVAGPLLFRGARSIDARFARTHRERDAMLGGISR
jgi:hypothetical protein